MPFCDQKKPRFSPVIRRNLGLCFEHKDTIFTGFSIYAYVYAHGFFCTYSKFHSINIKKVVLCVFIVFSWFIPVIADHEQSLLIGMMMESSSRTGLKTPAFFVCFNMRGSFNTDELFYHRYERGSIAERPSPNQ